MMEGKWVSVDEAMPEDFKPVLIAYGPGIAMSLAVHAKHDTDPNGIWVLWDTTDSYIRQVTYVRYWYEFPDPPDFKDRTTESETADSADATRPPSATPAKP